MVNIYVRWIKAGRMTIEQVPEHWQEAVRAAMGETPSETETP